MISFSSNILVNTAFKFSKINTKFVSQIVRNLATDVYIGNLPNSADQSALESFVQEKIGGTFTTVKLATDRETGNSRGFGWISFEEKSSADSAVAALAGTEFGGRTIKADISQPKEKRAPGTSTFGGASSFGASRTSTATEPKQSVYVGNLSYETGQDDLSSFVESVLGPGIVKSVRLSTDRETGRSKGFAHIEFSTPEDVNRAIEALSGQEMNGRALKVDMAQVRDKNAPRPERATRDFSSPRAGGAFGDRPQRNNPQHSVFIGNLAWSVDEMLIKEMVNDVLGPDLYLNVRLSVDRETGRSRGFGHIDFKDAESAARAVAELNDLEVEGRQIRADHAQAKTSTGAGAGGSGGRSGGSFSRGGPSRDRDYGSSNSGSNDAQNW